MSLHPHLEQLSAEAFSDDISFNLIPWPRHFTRNFQAIDISAISNGTRTRKDLLSLFHHDTLEVVLGFVMHGGLPKAHDRATVSPFMTDD